MASKQNNDYKRKIKTREELKEALYQLELIKMKLLKVNFIGQSE